MRALLVLFFGVVRSAAQDIRILNPIGEVNGNFWGAYMAEFGDPVRKLTKFDMFMAPNNLCTLPNLENATMYDHRQLRMGILVPRGGCNIERKVQVVLEMKKVIPTLHFLFVYETDPRTGNTGVTFSTSDARFYQNIALASIAYNAQVEILEIMENASQRRSQSPILLAASSWDWRFEFFIEGGGAGQIQQPYYDQFSWLRLFLFAMLIVAPCFRGFYLWYAGGGRIIWRRNRNNRIIGLLYVPPIPFWLSRVGGDPEAPNSPHQHISEEEFEKLPTIRFQRVQSSTLALTPTKSKPADPTTPVTVATFDESSEEAPDDNANDHEDSEEEDVILRLASADDDDCSVDSNADMAIMSCDLELGQSTSSDDDELALHKAKAFDEGEVVDNDAQTTTCTMCSICIDDFEPGEELIMLPKCKHAFHRDCIHPWLLERQGCCPLCKTNVLDCDETQTNTEEEDTEQQDAAR